jgi:hypothetical protein
MTGAGPDFLPERHQIVFDASPAPDGDGGEDLIQRLIYRTDLPYRKEYSAICYRAELNRRARAQHGPCQASSPDFARRGRSMARLECLP